MKNLAHRTRKLQSRILFIVISFFFTTAFANDTTENQFITLCYHDVKPTISPGDGLQTSVITTSELISQFSWLSENGYTPISLDDVIEAQRINRRLPDKAVLLTFDDGYQNIYTQVYPLLKLFNYPAVIGLVGAWLEESGSVQYGEQQVPRDTFLSWPQIKEMQQSGFVEFASHSYDLHRGIQANPQGNQLPAAVIRAYDNTYEDGATYMQRIRKDLQTNIELIEKQTGVRPRATIWPYGEYNHLTLEIARQTGNVINFGLGEDTNISNKDIVNRILVGHNMDLSDFAWLIRHKYYNKPVRVAHVDLDYIYDPDPDQQEKNLGLLLDRIKALKINTVYLQAFADPKGDGIVEQVYFPNRHMPMRSDLFSRVAWQLRTRSNVKVYAWMPVMSFQLPSTHSAANKMVSSTNNGKQSYRRLSPFSDDVRKVIVEIYEDLAKHSIFHGLLFHDDALLSDFEDASEEALHTYQKWGLPANVDEIRKNPDYLKHWSKKKTQFLIDWTLELTDRVKIYRPNIKTARNIYARVILEPESEQWFSQNIEAFLQHYDYTAVMAMPYMEQATHPTRWLDKLARQALSISGSPEHLVFELQSKDWRSNNIINDENLVAQMRVLQHAGIIHYGYYPDDFIVQRPTIKKLYPVMSLNQAVE